MVTDFDSGFSQWQGLYSSGQYAEVLDVRSRADVVDQHLMLRILFLAGRLFRGVVSTAHSRCRLSKSDRA